MRTEKMEEGHRKRKPLSDITNTYNLIPTSSLRMLVEASTNPSSSSKPPLSILKSNSVSSNERLFSESSNRSDASFKPFNVTGALNSRTVKFGTSPREISSIKPPGDGKSKDASYNQTHMSEKKAKETGEDEFSVASPTSVEKMKLKGAVPLSSSPSKNTKNSNHKEFWKPSILFERENKKGKTSRNLFSDLVELPKESTKGIFSMHNHSHEETEKGKEVLNTFSHVIGKQDGMEKSIVDHSSYSLEKTIEGKKATAKPFVAKKVAEKAILKHLGFSVLKTKEIKKELVNPSSSCLVTTRVEKGNMLYPIGASIQKSREKGKVIMQSSDDFEVTKSKMLSAPMDLNRQPLRTNAGKKKIDAGASSCPPMTRTKNLQIKADVHDIKYSSSWSCARVQPKLRKKRWMIKDVNEVPQDFIEKQRAYFKEVDDFELVEEEASLDELN